MLQQVRRHLAAVRRQLLHDFLVQPHVHRCRVFRVAGVVQIGRELPALRQAMSIGPCGAAGAAGFMPAGIGAPTGTPARSAAETRDSLLIPRLIASGGASAFAPA